MPLDYWLYIIGEKFGKLPHEIEESIDMRDFFSIIHMMNAIAAAESPNTHTERLH